MPFHLNILRKNKKYIAFYEGYSSDNYSHAKRKNELRDVTRIMRSEKKFQNDPDKSWWMESLKEERKKLRDREYYKERAENEKIMV